MLEAFRKLKSIVFTFALSLACGAYGVGGLRERFSWEPPVEAACDAAAFGGKRWVRISGCETTPAEAVGSYVKLKHSKGDGTLSSAYLPVRPAGSATEPTLVLHVRDPATLQLLGPSEPGAVAELMKAVRPVALPPVVVKVGGAPPKEVVEGAPQATLLLEASEDPDGKPELLWPLVSLAAAAFWLLGLVGSVFGKREPAEEPVSDLSA